jgi:hypothetical protein
MRSATVAVVDPAVGPRRKFFVLQNLVVLTDRRSGPDSLQLVSLVPCCRIAASDDFHFAGTPAMSAVYAWLV